jgi:elongation factor P
MTIKLNGELYRVFSFQHITPGNWRGMVQTKLKSVKSGSIIEHRFRSEDRIDQAYLETHEVEYLYYDASDYYFMNTETFEQFHLPADLLEDAIPFMIPNIKLQVEFIEGRAHRGDLPASVEPELFRRSRGLAPPATSTNRSLRSDRHSGKPFINEGELIRVDTSDGKYLNA